MKWKIVGHKLTKPNKQQVDNLRVLPLWIRSDLQKKETKTLDPIIYALGKLS